MKKLIVVAGAFGIIFLQSCGSDKKKEVESEPMISDQPTTQPEMVATDTAMLQPSAQPIEVNTSQPAINPVPAPANAPVATAAGMNPAHGQPGHKCEIPVGAPLNSAPSKPASTSQTNTPASIQSKEREKQKKGE